jgi:hypothetical protein
MYKSNYKIQIMLKIIMNITLCKRLAQEGDGGFVMLSSLGLWWRKLTSEHMKTENTSWW